MSGGEAEWRRFGERDVYRSWAAAAAGYVSVGPSVYLDRFVDEFGLTEEEVRGRVIAKLNVPFWSDGARSNEEWFVHESLLRSCGEFPCAGDAKALEFCREIVEEMVTTLGVPRDEAVARVNRQWSVPGESGDVPRVWIVGLSIAYHEDPHTWAGNIYYGHGSRWWDPSSTPSPLPPPVHGRPDTAG
ncbi:hypothetical protein [Pseudonocardia spinosispora]|uniref:hypothetical protein n=1 Tax=Pseudonocardia spinosispora TaxID=103441 RepID=UPI0012EBC6B8|nr:hypothetical protein [Pseudonocardia spinosispora]